MSGPASFGSGRECVSSQETVSAVQEVAALVERPHRLAHGAVQLRWPCACPIYVLPRVSCIQNAWRAKESADHPAEEGRAISLSSQGALFTFDQGVIA